MFSQVRRDYIFTILLYFTAFSTTYLVVSSEHKKIIYRMVTEIPCLDPILAVKLKYDTNTEKYDFQAYIPTWCQEL